MDRIQERQPHLVFDDKQEKRIHVIEFSKIRRIANGQEKPTDEQIKVLAKILLDYLENDKQV